LAEAFAFRHSFISLCAVLGVEESQIQAWAGHLSDEITTHLSKQHADRAVNRGEF